MKARPFFSVGLPAALMLALVAGLALAQAPAGVPLSAAFTYQGRLRSSDIPYTGPCDFQFGLWDADFGGTQVAPTQTVLNVGLADGYFTVVLDWGLDKFQGEARWLDIAVRCPAGGGTYTPLTPRQPLTATPYALYSLSADPLVMQQRVAGTCGSGYAIRVVNQDGSVTCEPVGGGGGDAWLLMGNSGTVPGTNFVGTTDGAALVFKVNNERAFRLESTPGSPNVIGGEVDNWAHSGVYGASIGGGGASGSANVVTDHYGTVSGGAGNQAGDAAGGLSDAVNATVGGGLANVASGTDATVGGGESNSASGQDATIGGGYSNAAGTDATVGGGGYNEATGIGSAVGGGFSNLASGDRTTIGGGISNSASGEYATIGGGANNVASGESATVAGGYGNVADDHWATIPGGKDNEASGLYSFAAGRRAKAWGDGSFVWGDSTDANVESGGTNKFVARASGGVVFYTNAAMSTGTYLPAGGNYWQPMPARAARENLIPVDSQAILETLASLPVQEYSLKSQDDSIRHVGPVAQDFAAFGYGESDKAINMEDADGVAMAAIQALYSQNQALKAENVDQQARIGDLQKQNASLDARLSALEQAAGGKPAQSGRSLLWSWLLAGGLVVAGGTTLAARQRWPGGPR